MSAAVRDSLRAIDEDTWIIGGKLLLSRAPRRSPDNISSGEDDFSYAFCEVEGPPPGKQSASAIPFPLVYDAGDSHAVWKVGDSYLKIIVPDSQKTTREHVTLDRIRHMLDGSGLHIPKVLYNGEWEGRYYLIVTGMPGQTLDRAWPRMNETDKTWCVSQISLFCSILSARKSTYIGGVDGRHLPERLLADREDDSDDRFSPDKLLQNCKKLEMDCSSFMLYHSDLGPGNILVDLPNTTISVIDFECVGFVPREWVRTKFRISGGLDLDLDDPEDEARYEWRSRMQRQFEIEGFSDVANTWMSWRYPDGQ